MRRLKRWTDRLLLRVVFWWLYGKDVRDLFREIVRSVRDDVRVPVYGRDQIRYGREARRDEAVYRAQRLAQDFFNLSDKQVNLGVEIAYQLGAPRKR